MKDPTTAQLKELQTASFWMWNLVSYQVSPLILNLGPLSYECPRVLLTSKDCMQLEEYP